MTRALLITNPFASRAHGKSATTIRDILQGGGWKVDVQATAGPGDARRIAEEARTGGFDVFVSHGGDGTAMQVAAGITGTNITLGLVPGGTGNVLANNLLLPRTATSAAHALLNARRVPIDLGVVERADGPHYFAVGAGAGFDAQLMADTGLQAKRRWKFAAYVARAALTLPTVRSATHRVVVDGTSTEVRAAMLLVLNCGKLPPGFLKLRARIAPDDGWLDVMALEADGALQSASALFQLLLGVWEMPGRRVWWSRGRSVRVELPDGQERPVQLDGEVTGTTPFEVRLLPGALSVLVGSGFEAKHG
ncbi:MAG TPA: diacylglycerol kinase family protein [Gemmatimonadales bacterium]|nr:diacylglycerol kinase family protein [Gemmatimonadales bacterium]